MTSAAMTTQEYEVRLARQVRIVSLKRLAAICRLTEAESREELAQLEYEERSSWPLCPACEGIGCEEDEPGKDPEKCHVCKGAGFLVGCASTEDVPASEGCAAVGLGKGAGSDE